MKWSFYVQQLGHKLLNRKQTVDIREELDSYNISEKVKEYRAARKENLLNMDNDKRPKKVYQYKV